MKRFSFLLGLALLAAAGCGPDETLGHEGGGITIATMRSGLSMSGAGGCDTSIAAGLNAQLIEELNCVAPNLMVNFSGPHVTLYSSVLPWLAPGAARDLKAATTAANDTMTISSAYRTLGQQYLLYKWWKAGQCGIQVAAVPGNSNHQSGRAIDTPYYSAWRAGLTAQGWTWLGSSDLVHFDHLGSPNVASNSVLAFQRLWNKNHTTGRLMEDGDWGPATESAMAQAPTTGFPTHGCPTTGVLSGVITDRANANPLSGVTVSAAGQSLTTSSTGAFHFDLPAGSVTVSATKAGYMSASATKTVVVGGTVSASLALNTVASTGSLEGTVVDAADASPVAGATISASGHSAITSATGAFSLSLPAGSVSFTASRAGFGTKSTSVTVTAGQVTTSRVQLVRVSGAQAPTIELTTMSGASHDVARLTLVGSVTDDGPLPSTLTLSQNGRPGQAVPLDASGSFSADVQLEPGANQFELRVTDSTGLVGVTSWEGRFRAGFAGHVHRFDSAALIVADAELTLIDPDTGSTLGSTRSDVDGAYSIDSTAAGLKRLHVEKAGYTPRDQLVLVSAEERDEVDVALTVGETASIRFIEPTTVLVDAPEVTISGVVTGLEVTGVEVNGTPAQLLGNGFVVKVPLGEGAQEFVVTASSGEGQSVSATITAGRPLSAARGGCSSAPFTLMACAALGLIRRRRSARLSAS